MMSTADSQLLIATSTIVEDFYSKVLRRSVTQKQLVLFSRVATVGVGMAGFNLACMSDDLIYDVVSLAWAGLGASFGPAVLLSLHWKKMTGAGVLASMITGAVSTAAWKWIPGLDDIISVRFASFAFATAAAVVFSLMTKTEQDKPT